MLAKPIIQPNAIYTREEAAQCLGVSLSTLKQLIRAGHLVVSQPGGMRRIFIRGTSILEMLDRTTKDSLPHVVNQSGLQDLTLPVAASPSSGKRWSLAQQVHLKNNTSKLALRSKRNPNAREGRDRVGSGLISRARGGASR